jgi:hypothetical protein
MKIRNEIRLFFLMGLILTLGLAACAPASGEPEGEAPEEEAATSAPEAEATEPPAGGETGGGEAMGAIVIDATDACSLLTQEQVAAAFGKEVTTVEAASGSGFGGTIATGCDYEFGADTDTKLRVTFYDGDAAKQYFYALVTAAGESCDAFFEKLFDIGFGQSGEAGMDLSSTLLGDLYRQYVEIFEGCPSYVNITDRTDVGENVLTTELIVFNWTSNVAVLGADRVVELTYQEPISAEAQADFQTTNDRESFYAAAQPYADSILAGYTETLIDLLHEATMQ